MPRFEALGAIVVGVSGDGAATLAKFSAQACHGKFSVASDSGMAAIEAYDAVMTTRPDHTNRISYVIAPGGAIVYQYTSLNPARHVDKTLEALWVWREREAKP